MIQVYLKDKRNGEFEFLTSCHDLLELRGLVHNIYFNDDEDPKDFQLWIDVDDEMQLWYDYSEDVN